MKKLKVYISGAMTAATPQEFQQNVQHFHDAALLLKAQGYKPINPACVLACRFSCLYRLLERLLGKDGAYRLVLVYDLWLLSRCDQLCMISGWRNSRGACTEEAVAHRLAIPKVFTYDAATQQLSVYGMKPPTPKKKKRKHPRQP